MNEDVKIKELTKKIADQAEQITSLRKALDKVNHKLNSVATRQGHIKDNVRRLGNDINTIKQLFNR